MVRKEVFPHPRTSNHPAIEARPCLGPQCAWGLPACRLNADVNSAPPGSRVCRRGPCRRGWKSVSLVGAIRKEGAKPWKGLFSCRRSFVAGDCRRFRRLQVGEGFLIAGVRQVVPHLAVHLAPVRCGPGGNLFGNGFQRVQMVRRIAVAPGMVGDDRHAAAQQLGEFGNHDAANQPQDRGFIQFRIRFRWLNPAGDSGPAISRHRPATDAAMRASGST